MTSPAEPAGEPARATRVPDFFIVGQPKSGTTALYEILRRHPQIYMPELKEPMFLASDLLAGLLRQTVRARPQTLEEYLALFSDATAQQRAGEASALYLSSQDAAANIARLQPHARIIAILREPASFLRSLHLQLLQDRNETVENLRDALALEDDRRQGRHLPRECPRPAALLYSDYVHYVEQLRRYHAVFPAEQVLVLAYEDFRRDNASTVAAVLRFLDVDDVQPLEATEANRSVRVRSRRLESIVQSVSTGRGPLLGSLKRPVKTLTSRRLRRGALRMARRRVLYTEPPAPDDGVMLELRRRFKGEVVALSEYLNRDFVGLWGYDKLS
jgi:Sulfotransferase family